MFQPRLAIDIDVERAAIGKDRLGGKSRQREWLVDFAMGQTDIDCGRFDRAARRSARLLRDGPGYFTDGYGSLLSARLHLHWQKLDLALEDARRALGWAQNPEVRAKLFEFRVLGVVADIYIAGVEWSRALQSLEQMQPFAQEKHSTPYFAIEVMRRRAQALSFNAPAQAQKVAEEALGLTSLVHCPKQIAELHLLMAQIQMKRGASAPEIRTHFAQACEIFRRLGNRFQERLVSQQADAFVNLQ